MKSRVELEIEAQQGDVAAIFADPYSIPRWMEEIESRHVRARKASRTRSTAGGHVSGAGDSGGRTSDVE
jgi:hypothetical protein